MAIFKTNINNPQKYLLRPKCICSGTNYSFRINRVQEIIFNCQGKNRFWKLKKTFFTEIFHFSKSNKSCLGEAKIFLKLFFQDKAGLWTIWKKKFFSSSSYSENISVWSLQKILKLLFFIKFFDNKHLCWKNKIHLLHMFRSKKPYPVETNWIRSILIPMPGY